MSNIKKKLFQYVEPRLKSNSNLRNKSKLVHKLLGMGLAGRKSSSLIQNELSDRNYFPQAKSRTS